MTAIAGGNAPDLVFFDRFKVGSWANQGSLTSLTEYAERDGISREDFYEYTWDESSYEDDLYAVPLTTDSRLLFYNKDHFSEVGLDPDNPPTTIAELEEAADLLTIIDGNRIERLGLIPWISQGWLYS